MDVTKLQNLGLKLKIKFEDDIKLTYKDYLNNYMLSL